MDLGDKNATDHSLEKNNNSIGKQLFNNYMKQHFKNDFMNRDNVEDQLLRRAIKRFGQIYSSTFS